ncbi:hypothetical protein Aab01nite_04960 [Paractinoplanes abujensis]|nr:hypothetical protein Aab01nite_04960 [Actinoplanes abujensis]
MLVAVVVRVLGAVWTGALAGPLLGLAWLPALLVVGYLAPLIDWLLAAVAAVTGLVIGLQADDGRPGPVRRARGLGVFLIADTVLYLLSLLVGAAALDLDVEHAVLIVAANLVVLAGAVAVVRSANAATLRRLLLPYSYVRKPPVERQSWR